jgi:sulfoxide reductase heme-binding subunit YedZ
MSLPLAGLVWGAIFDQLGANPAEALIRASGDWTLRALCLVLALTPLRVMTGVAALARFRRMVGLFVFFYASLHGLAYAWLDMGFAWQEVLADLVKRPFILVGFVSLCLLLALAVTSNDWAIRRLGGKGWKRLHRSVYATAGLALLHFFWMRAGKNDFAEVGLYAILLGALLVWRVVNHCKKAR